MGGLELRSKMLGIVAGTDVVLGVGSRSALLAVSASGINNW